MRRVVPFVYALCGFATVLLVGTASGADIWPVRTIAYAALAGTSAAAGVLLKSSWWALTPLACVVTFVVLDRAIDDALTRAADFEPFLLEPVLVMCGLGLGVIHLIANAVGRKDFGREQSQH